MRASSRPETAVFCNLFVSLRASLCGVPEYASAEPLAFLDLAEKQLVSESVTTPVPSLFGTGTGYAPAMAAAAERAVRTEVARNVPSRAPFPWTPPPPKPAASPTANRPGIG